MTLADIYTAVWTPPPPPRPLQYRGRAWPATKYDTATPPHPPPTFAAHHTHLPGLFARGKIRAKVRKYRVREQPLAFQEHGAEVDLELTHVARLALEDHHHV